MWWRDLQENTDQTGRNYVTAALVLFAVGVLAFIAGILVVVSGHIAVTLPFWFGMMACAGAALGLIYAASRRGNALRK
jgi:hypothetical protein